MWQEQLQPTNADRIKKHLLALRDALFARQGGMAYLPIALVTFFMFCGTSWMLFLPASDPARYQCYAITFWFGGNATQLLPSEQCSFLRIIIPQPLHMLPTEYPPLTLAIFSLPLLLPMPYYQFAFALLMSLIAMVIYWLLQRYGPRGSALMFALYLLVGALTLAQMRFDLLPALCMLICIILAERRQWTSAYLVLALGVLFKIYPILLLPALFIAEQRSLGRLISPPSALKLRTIWDVLQNVRQWRWRNSAIFLLTLISITALFALFNFHDAVISQLEYFQQRPLQVEAVGSSVIWLTSLLGLPSWQGVLYNYGSINVISPLSAPISLLGSCCFVAGVVFVLWKQWQNQLDLAQASIALLLVFISTGKVFSPQYLMWIIPLLAYAGAFDAFWLLFWGAISLLTTLHFSLLGSQLPRLITPHVVMTLPDGFNEIISVRNFFFVFVTLAYLFNWFHARIRQSLPPPPTRAETQPLHL